MFTRLLLLIALSLALIPFLALSACTQEKGIEVIGEPSATLAAPSQSSSELVQHMPASGHANDPTVLPLHQPSAQTSIPTLSPPLLPLIRNEESVPSVAPEPLMKVLPTVEVVKALKPSVVQVVNERVAVDFFNQPMPSKGVGTGVILDNNGHILTNNHVIAGAQRITVTLGTGDSFTAEVIGGDLTTDLAVIRIKAQGLTAAKMGRSSEVQVGEDVIAIGHALGLSGGPTVSKGVISAVDRSIDADPTTTLVDLFQTDASINSGNSGGPLANTRAEVIGINTAIIESGRGIGFAINIDDARAVAAQLVDKGYVDRGFLGITPVNVTPGVANRFDLAVDKGILVAQLLDGSAAIASGLSIGDVIVRLGNVPIHNTGELSKFLMANPPGNTVDLVYYRDDFEVFTHITLGKRPKR